MGEGIEREMSREEIEKEIEDLEEELGIYKNNILLANKHIATGKQKLNIRDLTFDEKQETEKRIHDLSNWKEKNIANLISIKFTLDRLYDLSKTRKEQ